MVVVVVVVVMVVNFLITYKVPNFPTQLLIHSFHWPYRLLFLLLLLFLLFLILVPILVVVVLLLPLLVLFFPFRFLLFVRRWVGIVSDFLYRCTHSQLPQCSFNPGAGRPVYSGAHRRFCVRWRRSKRRRNRRRRSKRRYLPLYTRQPQAIFVQTGIEDIESFTLTDFCIALCQKLETMEPSAFLYVFFLSPFKPNCDLNTLSREILRNLTDRIFFLLIFFARWTLLLFKLASTVVFSFIFSFLFSVFQTFSFLLAQGRVLQKEQLWGASSMTPRCSITEYSKLPLPVADIYS